MERSCQESRPQKRLLCPTGQSWRSHLVGGREDSSLIGGKRGEKESVRSLFYTKERGRNFFHVAQGNEVLSTRAVRKGAVLPIRGRKGSCSPCFENGKKGKKDLHPIGRGKRRSTVEGMVKKGKTVNRKGGWPPHEERGGRKRTAPPRRQEEYHPKEESSEGRAGLLPHEKKEAPRFQRPGKGPRPTTVSSYPTKKKKNLLQVQPWQ